MNKKATELTMQTIVIAVLCLVILFILIFIFRDQVGRQLSGYNLIAQQSENQSRGETCGGFFNDYQCFAKCPDGYSISNMKGCTGSTPVCCKKS